MKRSSLAVVFLSALLFVPIILASCANPTAPNTTSNNGNGSGSKTNITTTTTYQTNIYTLSSSFSISQAPTDLFIDGSSQIWVLDYGTTSYFSIYSLAGSLLSNRNSFTGYTETSFVVDGGGYIYNTLLSTGYRRHQPNGSFANFGSSGSGNGQFSAVYGPMGIALDNSSNLYIVDENNYRIQKISTNFAYLSQWGSYGTGNGQFNKPIDVVYESNSSVLFVLDGPNNWSYRVQKFDLNGNYLSQWSVCEGSNNYPSPKSMCADSSGNLFIYETYNKRVFKYSSNGIYYGKFTVSGANSYANGIAVSSGGVVTIGVAASYSGPFSVKSYVPGTNVVTNVTVTTNITY